MANSEKGPEVPRHGSKQEVPELSQNTITAPPPLARRTLTLLPNLVLEGKMELFIGGKTMILEEGDSIYFDSSKPHGMLAVGDKPVKFLAFTVE